VSRPKPRRRRAPGIGACATLVILLASTRAFGHDQSPTSAGGPSAAEVVTRVREHAGAGASTFPIVLAVGPSTFPPQIWDRVKNLVAFRIHRPAADGTTAVDAAIYLVRDSPLYLKAATSLNLRTTNQEYVWCLLAASLAHEAAHTAPNTERQALIAELAQLEQCLQAGHLHAADGWSAGRYLQQVRVKLRHPREHY
jgi:hypothetical protein